MSTTTNGTPTATKTTKTGTGSSPSKNSTAKRSADFPVLPPAPAPHVFGTGYSAKHKVPKAQDWQQINQRHQQQADEYARIMEMREQAQLDEDRLAKEGPTSEEEGQPAYVHVDGDGDAVNPQDSPTTAGNKVAGEGGQSRKRADPKNAANEKQRLMDQMTSFTGELQGVEAKLTECREADRPHQEGPEGRTPSAGPHHRRSHRGQGRRPERYVLSFPSCRVSAKRESRAVSRPCTAAPCTPSIVPLAPCALPAAGAARCGHARPCRHDCCGDHLAFPY